MAHRRRRRSPTSSATPGADRVRVAWRCDGESAGLEVTDNGIGFPEGRPGGRLDSYGMIGMRERAASIGATLDVASKPNEGTRVRCSLLRAEEPATPSGPGGRP